MGREARADYETKYKAENHYQTLMEIYTSVTAVQPAKLELKAAGASLQ